MTGKYSLRIDWPSGRHSSAGVITEDKWGAIAKILAPDWVDSSECEGCPMSIAEEMRNQRDAALAELAASDQALRESRANDMATMRTLAEAREELAALKGGQEPVAMLRYARKVPGFENEMPHVVSCNDLPDGLYPVYLAPPAQASAWGAERYTCIGKGGSYLRVGTSIGAGDNRGEIVEVYRDESNGQLYHRDTENFFVRMTAAPTPGASDGKGGE